MEFIKVNSLWGIFSISAQPSYSDASPKKERKNVFEINKRKEIKMYEKHFLSFLYMYYTIFFKKYQIIQSRLSL